MAANIPAAIKQRYQFYKSLGEGTYGAVHAATDSKTGQLRAVKRIKTIEDVIDAKRILREVKMLVHFAGHENIVLCTDLIVDPMQKDWESIYMVTEMLDNDLYQILRRTTKPLVDEQVCWFAYQVIRGLKYLHSANVLHRDLKPNNLLVNTDCDLKICDFGLARLSSEESEEQPLMTCYVVTRYYRPPELLVGSKRYTAAIDMWSVGCIIAELITGKALLPGKNYLDMIGKIVSLLGNPTEPQMHFCTDKAKNYLGKLPASEGIPLAQLLPKASAQAIDLISCLLKFDPNERLTAAQALEHPYFTDYHDPDDEPCSQPFACDFENDENLTEEDCRAMIFEEVAAFRKKMEERL